MADASSEAGVGTTFAPPSHGISGVPQPRGIFGVWTSSMVRAAAPWHLWQRAASMGEPASHGQDTPAPSMADNDANVSFSPYFLYIVLVPYVGFHKIHFETRGPCKHLYKVHHPLLMHFSPVFGSDSVSSS
jgi:hypothetical protein